MIQGLIDLGDARPKPAIRLVVNEQLDRLDVEALIERGDTSSLEKRLLSGLTQPADELVSDRLAMLAWLYVEGLLDLRVGLMRHGGDIVHGKFGIAYDEAGDSVVFAGSGNETARGLRGNYEQIEVSISWGGAETVPGFDPDVHATIDLPRLRNYENEFDLLWRSVHPDVFTLPLPTAVAERLISFAPHTAPTVRSDDTRLEQRRLAMLWRWLAEAPYLSHGGAEACDAVMPVDLWPHQQHVVADTMSAWPDGRILCDEVGMGKTLEAIAVLRRLLSGRGVARALLLVPAGLLEQWQGELREKGGLLVARLEGSTRLVQPDGTEQRVSGLSEALTERVLLMSREAARSLANRPTLLAAEPWDLVVLDESHAARRAKPEERQFNTPNLLLGLVRSLRASGTAGSILLLSATPMQTCPWEPWDLLDVLGEGNPWFAEFSDIRAFYGTAAALADGDIDQRQARLAAELIDSDEQFEPITQVIAGLPAGVSTWTAIGFPRPGDRLRIADWMRRNSPLARRMHRNTRATLRRYHEMGLLDTVPPRRSIDDIRYDYEDQAERDLYDAIDGYIERRFKLLQHDPPGKGFVLTIYRRRASSSPLAFVRSLSKRREQLERVVQNQATDQFLDDDNASSVDLDDLDDSIGFIPASLPSSAENAEDEIREINALLEGMAALNNTDTKRDVFVRELRKVTDEGRAVLVFTTYTDTMEYLRDLLMPLYGDQLACYSGAGGQLLEYSTWASVSKTAITDALQDGSVCVLLCTDAASEGLNLQAASALINYDLPWNPSKVEQRIGRIDRIGQAQPIVRVINLYLRHSVDDDVYLVLRSRCGLFERFVGPMQPVLARARRMLVGGESPNPEALQADADSVANDHLAHEVYIESDPAHAEMARAPVTRSELIEILFRSADYHAGPVRVQLTVDTATITGTGSSEIVVSTSADALADDPSIVPLSLLDSVTRSLADAYDTGEGRTPLVIGTSAEAGHRVAIAWWVGPEKTVPIEDLSSLIRFVDVWDGTPADAERWVQALTATREAATNIVSANAARTLATRNCASGRRRGAARRRLQRELGRFLAAYAHGTGDLNGEMYRLMQGDGEEARRLRRAFELLGGYPEWSPSQISELDEFEHVLTDYHRNSRLSGMEVEAALADPRWSEPTLAQVGSPG
jgi:superfamily II DNA or RNA helicase